MAAQVPSRLYRSRSQKMIAGVCGGLGEYFDVDPVLIRLMFVVTTFISGAGILAYIVLWIVVPFEGEDSARMDALKRDFDDLTGRVRQYMDPVRPGTGAGAGATPASGQPAPGGPDVSGYHGGFGAGGFGSGAYGPGSQAPGSSAPGPYSPGPHGFGAPAGGPGASAGGPAMNTMGFPTPGPASAASSASVAHSSRDASMPQDTATARVPASDDPTATSAEMSAAGADTGAAGAPSDAAGSARSSKDAPDLAAPASGAAPASAQAGSPADADEDPFRIELDPPASPPPGTPPYGSAAPSPGSQPGQSAPPFGTPPFGSPYGPQSAPPSGSPFGSPFGAPGAYGSGVYGWSSAPRDADAADAANDVPFGATAAPPSDRKRRRQHWAGAILILIGTLILGNNLGLLWWLEFEYFFPLVLVGLGAWLLLGRGRRG